MEFIGKEQFGTFRTQDTLRVVPTRPWVTDGDPGNLSERGNGNIRAYRPEENDFTIGDTNIEQFTLTWVHLRKGAKHLYICDRVLLTNISWNVLKDRGMIEGTPVTIDGKKYTLRSIDGGANMSGAVVPADNEWDTIVCNKLNIVGLPKPTEEDFKAQISYAQLDGQHNQMWHWWGINTMCQKEYYEDTSQSVRRGYAPVNAFGYSYKDRVHKSAGWRPVLEYIESEPPEKPEILYPNGTISEPTVSAENPLTVKTKFNNPGGEFNTMKLFITDVELNKIVFSSQFSALEFTIPKQLDNGRLFKLTVSHKNTNNQTSPDAESYFIYGHLNKYKLSEPITISQFENIKSYTGGEDLIMKPQTFPETENSAIRLVPQVMNTLTAGETNTNELEYTASTKQPVIGDRLIKDKEVYTISKIKQGVELIHVDSTIETMTGVDKPTLSWTYWSATKSYVYNGYAYIAFLRGTTLRVVGIPLEGGKPIDIWTSSVSNLRNLTVTGNRNMLYVLKATATETALLGADLDTRLVRQPILPRGGDQVALSATIDSKTGYLVYVAKEFNASQTYQLAMYWIDISDLTNIKTVDSQILINNVIYSEVGNPAIVDVEDVKADNLCVYCTRITGDKCELKEHRYKDLTQEGTSTLWIEPNITNALDTEVVAKHIKDKNNESILVISAKYPTLSTPSVIKTQIMRKGTQLYPKVTESGVLITNQRITYSKEQGIGLVYATSEGKLYKRFIEDYDKPIGASEQISIFTPRPAGRHQLFEVIDYNPYTYGKYPGLLILEYDTSNKVDRLMLRSDYSMDEPKPDKLILDKPISTHAGKNIKFLDYDLEVKAGETKATITPTNITDDYYEYDASFNKKEAERKVTVVGRNSKLTTLYYYNY